jgi:protein ImuA
MNDRDSKIVGLRQSLARSSFDSDGAHHVPLGHGGADNVLYGGLRSGALHEVYSDDQGHAASACGFAFGLALRLCGTKPLFWIATEFASLEFGSLNATGVLELGVDPRRLVLVRVAQATDALRAASDILACGAAGALVLEIPGAVKALDLTASRRLSLAAAAKKISVILLRPGAKPQASAAETRWLVQACGHPPNDWDNPRFDARLIRNRHGELGHWDMEWDDDSGIFRLPLDQPATPDHGAVAAAPADGSAATEKAFRNAG